ncbi:MAG: hypothetical protein K2J64_03220 [Desulfovibrio sp.]|nr:hypothetical protein [Desulfovibrio sp.]
MRKLIKAQTRRGVQLDGVLFSKGGEQSVVIAITGIHGNFYSNPMYYNIGDTLSDNGIAFVYTQTNDAFNKMETFNTKTGDTEIIGSYNECSTTSAMIFPPMRAPRKRRVTCTSSSPGIRSAPTR